MAFQRIHVAFPEHILNIPEKFIYEIDELGDFEIITSTNIDLMKPHKVAMDFILRSREIKSVTPVLYPYLDKLIKNIDSFNSLELIVTREVWRTARNIIENCSGKLKIYVIFENPHLMLIVTELFFCMGFCRESGEYDFSKNLISKKKTAIEFGEQLYSYYKKKSERVL